MTNSPAECLQIKGRKHCRTTSSCDAAVTFIGEPLPYFLTRKGCVAALLESSAYGYTKNPPNRQCLLDAYQISQCPNCGRTVTSTMGGQQQVLCNLNNEGGLQENLDILPILSEESYLKAYPEERKCRAFLEFCKEGDVEAIVDLLNDDDEVDDGNDNDGTDGVDGVVEAVRMNAANILRYQDPIGSMASGLHLAVMNGVVEVIWLLLLLASNLELDEFPTEVRTTAEQMGVIREDQSGKTDIRALKDSNGMTAEEVASGTAWGSPFDLTLLRP